MASRPPAPNAGKRKPVALPVVAAAPAARPAVKPPASDAPGVTLAIQGMHCASCVTTIEKALSAVPGVEEASVNLGTARAQIRGRGLDPPLLVEAVRGSGYDAKPVEEAAPAEEDEAARREARSVLSRTLVAALLTLPVVVVSMADLHFPGRNWALRM